MPMFNYSLGKYLAFSPPSPTLVARLVERHARSADAYVAFVKKFDERVESERKSLIVLFAPALALVLSRLFAWRPARRGVPSHYGAHLVFALHLLTFIWLALAGWGVVAAIMAGRAPSRLGVVAVAVVGVLLIGAAAHAFLAVRRVYELSALSMDAGCGRCAGRVVRRDAPRLPRAVVFHDVLHAVASPSTGPRGVSHPFAQAHKRPCWNPLVFSDRRSRLALVWYHVMVTSVVALAICLRSLESRGRIAYSSTVWTAQSRLMYTSCGRDEHARSGWSASPSHETEDSRRVS